MRIERGAQAVELHASRDTHLLTGPTMEDHDHRAFAQGARINRVVFMGETTIVDELVRSSAIGSLDSHLMALHDLAEVVLVTAVAETSGVLESQLASTRSKVHRISSKAAKKEWWRNTH